MDKHLKKINAFTLAEVMIVFAIIGIVVVATLKPVKDMSTSYLNKFMYYSAFTNLSAAVGRMLSDGCTTSDISNGYCLAGALPKVGTTGTSGRGFCDRLAELFNTVGTVDCTKSGTVDANYNFRTTNSMKFYNVYGSNPTATYTIYIDIDGDKRNHTSNVDLLAFTINTDGTVLPEASSAGAQNTNYLTASVRYKSGSNFIWVATGVPYRDAYCDAKGTYPSGGYTCPTVNTTIYNASCLSNNCKIVINKPGFMFFTR